MTDYKHTPGPWRFIEDGRTEELANACKPLTIGSPADDDLANIYSSDDATVSTSREEAIANAHLIAAAPDLLAALKAMDDAWCAGMETQSARMTARLAFISARAAIAKAEGRS